MTPFQTEVFDRTVNMAFDCSMVMSKLFEDDIEQERLAAIIVAIAATALTTAVIVSRADAMRQLDIGLIDLDEIHKEIVGRVLARYEE